MIGRSLLLACAVLLAGCANGSNAAPEAGPVIVASTSILADITQNIVGDGAEVQALLPIGSDPHSYQPVPADLVKIEESTVLIVNGFGYERFIEPLMESAGGGGILVIASAGLQARQSDGAPDPHAWLSPDLVIAYVQNIRDALCDADPSGEAMYRANADAYMDELTSLDAWISEQAGLIPAERRVLVTNHEALGYFAERYGFEIAGTVLRNVSSAASPSAQELSAVIDEIRESGSPAIFLDEAENPALAEQIAEETGVRIVDDLHLESLTAGPPAATYLDMMRYNVTRLVEALK